MRGILVAAAVTALVALQAFAGTPQSVVLDVQNMTCPVCPITVKKSLERVPGVADVKIDFHRKTATVNFDPDKANGAALVKATTEAGYPSTVHK